jgi:transposase
MKRSGEKTENLRKVGALHPNSKKVSNKNFSEGNGFFDPEDLVQVKYEMLRSVKHDGVSVLDAASNFGLSRPSYYHAKEQFFKHGLLGLLPQKRGPRHARKFTNEVKAFISRQIEKSETVPSWEELSEAIREEFGQDVHPRSIERVVRNKKKLS